MGRYRTPRGVVIEVSDKAAQVVGYRPAEQPTKAPKKSASRKKAEADEPAVDDE